MSPGSWVAAHAPCLLWMPTAQIPIVHEIEDGVTIVVEIRPAGVPQQGEWEPPHSVPLASIMTVLSRVGLKTLRRIAPVLPHHSSAWAAHVGHKSQECDLRLCT